MKKKKQELVQATIRFTEKEYKRLTKVAKKEGRSFAELVRDVMEGVD